MTNTERAERAAFNRGWDDGEHNAISACFPQHKRPWPHSFDSPEEEEAYDRGYRNGSNSID